MNTLSALYSSPKARIGKRYQRGVGLLEVMIAVLVLGVGVLGVIALQTMALKNTDSSAISSQATIQVYAMFDLLRANNDKREGGQGIPSDLTTGDVFKKGSGTRSANKVGTLDDWLASLQETLGPDAEGKVKCDDGYYGVGNTKNAKCTVAVQWDDSRGTKTTDKAATRMIEMEILL